MDVFIRRAGLSNTESLSANRLPQRVRPGWIRVPSTEDRSKHAVPTRVSVSETTVRVDDAVFLALSELE